MIRIDHENCIGCGACVDVCNVTKVFQLSDGKAQAVHPGRCWQCGQCVAVCPVDAVQHEIFPIGKSPLAGKTPGNLNNISKIFAIKPKIMDLIQRKILVHYLRRNLSNIFTADIPERKIRFSSTLQFYYLGLPPFQDLAGMMLLSLALPYNLRLSNWVWRHAR